MSVKSENRVLHAAAGGKTKIKRSRGDFIFDCVNYLILGLVLVIILYPLYFIVIASISDPNAVQSGAVLLWPKDITFEGYRQILSYRSVWIGYRNTIIQTVTSTVFSVVVTMMTAYPMSRKNFLGKNVMLAFLMITMYFSGGLIPTYLQVKRLHLLNTLWAIILVGCISVYNIIISRTFLQTNVPEELYEAAAIDGCSHFQYFFKVVMPLSKALLAVLALYYGIGVWNNYFEAMIYLNDSDLYPLQLVLKNILVSNQVEAEMMTSMDYETMEEKQRFVDLMKYGLLIVSTVPVLAVYPFLPKYFVKGVMIGSVKG